MVDLSMWQFLIISDWRDKAFSIIAISGIVAKCLKAWVDLVSEKWIDKAVLSFYEKKSTGIMSSTV